jgi:hypothetical protein
MFAESNRPNFIEDVIGHQEIKEELSSYLKNEPFSKALFMIGPPGIGKTTLALCAARTFEFDALEINASKTIRSFEDVEKLRDSCRSCVNIQSFIRGNVRQKTCVILDEVDGSDPHAQAKIIDWIKDPTRTVPLLCTGNELPAIFKRNMDLVKILRCYPPKAVEVQHLFPGIDVPQVLKECQHDIRRVFHRLQYGESYAINEYPLPPTGTPVEIAFLWRQKMFELPNPLECLSDKLDSVHLHETSLEYKTDGKNVDKSLKLPRQKRSNPGKSRKSA